jgi:hypothetical protein
MDAELQESLHISYIGKKTAKGVVIRRLNRGRMTGQWFLANLPGDKMGQPLVMPGFAPVTDAEEVDTICFFARRAFAEFYG